LRFRGFSKENERQDQGHLAKTGERKISNKRRRLMETDSGGEYERGPPARAGRLKEHIALKTKKKKKKIDRRKDASTEKDARNPQWCKRAGGKLSRSGG